MAWISIADVVTEFRAHIGSVAGVDDLRTAGAELAVRARGMEFVQEFPELVNFGVLTVLAQPFRVHELRGSVRDLVGETDLHSLPDVAPELIRRAFIVQTRDPEREVLFGATAALAGYELDGTRYLIGLDYPDGCRVGRWRPEWRGSEVAAGVVQEHSGGLIDDVQGHEDWTRAAARFVVVLGLLLDAEGTPLVRADEGPALAGTRHGKQRPARPWAVRRVYLEHERVERSAGAAGGAAEDVDARIAAEVRVTGHLKRQPYGPGLAQRKWVYVQSYEARRWFTTAPTRVVVS